MLRDVMDRIGTFRFMDIPVGKSALLLIFMGVGKVVGGLFPQFLGRFTPVVTTGGAAYLARRFGRGFFGDAGSEAVATGVFAGGVDQSFKIIESVAALVEKLKPSGVPSEEYAGEEYAGELGEAAVPELGEATAPALGEVGDVYLTDVEKKLQAALAVD